MGSDCRSYCVAPVHTVLLSGVNFHYMQQILHLGGVVYICDQGGRPW